MNSTILKEVKGENENKDLWKNGGCHVIWKRSKINVDEVLT